MLQGLAASLLDGVMNVVPFLFVLTVVVFVHELGHFLVARWCGVKVKTFSIGFGHEIFGFHDRHGTRWRLAWIPLGGYVKFMDDENAASVPSREAIARMSPAEREGSFHAKPIWQRSAIVVAGPIANFLLAILVFAVVAYALGVRLMEPRIESVVAGSAAEAAGLKAGDLIVEIDGGEIQSFRDLQRVVTLSAGRKLDVRIRRNGDTLVVPVTPKKQVIEDPIGGTSEDWRIGIQQTNAELQYPSLLGALKFGLAQTRDVTLATIYYVYDVVSLQRSPDQLGGPIRIADISRKVAKLGFEVLVQFTCLISISVGLVNLLPIPLLDGGHLMFYAIEALRRRPLSERSQEYGFRIGMVIVLMLMFLALYNDRTTFWSWFPKLS
jgi:regulator of sigma E protease